MIPTSWLQQLSTIKKQLLCGYCETHGLCIPAKDRTQPQGNGCYYGFVEHSQAWCSQWNQLDDFKIALITRSKNESK